jgi:hypothetical protein
MLTQQQIIDIETGYIPTLQGGRIDFYTDNQIMWQPYKHNLIGLYNGSRWVPVSTSTPMLSTPSPVTISGSTLASGVNYDVYAKYQSDTSFTLEFQPWATASGRYSAPVRSDGVLVYNATALGKTYRFLGTARLNGITGTPKFTDSFEQRFIVNWYNTKPAIVRTYNSSTTVYTYNGGGNIVVEYGTNMAAILAANVRGEFLSIHKNMGIGGAFSVGHPSYINQYFSVGMGLNSTAVFLPANSYTDQDSGNPNVWSPSMAVNGNPNEGYNYITILVKSYNDQSSNAPYLCMTNQTPGDAGGGYVLVMV